MILDKIKSQKEKVGESAINDYIKEINDKAISKARAEMLIELEEAKARAVRAEAERDAIKTMHEGHSLQVESLTMELKSLKDELMEKTRQISLANENIVEIKRLHLNELTSEREKQAMLEKRLLEKPKPIQKQAVIQPMVIPEMDLRPIRDEFGQIQKVIMTPRA